MPRSFCRTEPELLFFYTDKRGIKPKKKKTEKERRWRVLGNSQITLIGVSLERSCGWAEAHGAVAVTAALWQRPGNSCVCLFVCI